MGTCSHCGYESRGTATCPLCGGTVLGSPSGAPGRPSASFAPPEPPAGPAWEDPSVPFPVDFVRTLAATLREPGAFFRGVPWDAAAARPVLFYLLVTVAAALGSLFWEAAFARGATPWMAELGLASPELNAGTALLGFFFTPFAALAWLALWGLLLHLFVLFLARDGRRGLGATFRAVCYASSPGLLALVPFVGPVVGSVWTLVLTAIGVREAHRMSGGQAAGAVILAALTPIVLFVGLLVLAVIAGGLVR